MIDLDLQSGSLWYDLKAAVDHWVAVTSRAGGEG
jgi:hypothetical protein